MVPGWYWLTLLEENRRVSSNTSDTGLVKRAKEGDVQAFRQLVEKYKDVSLSLACSILKDRAAAEDVLQDSFFKVYSSLHSFKEQAAFSSWLYRIVVNTSFTAYQKLKKYSDRDEVSEMQNQYFHQSNPLKLEDQKKCIQEALNRLKPDEALVLRLFYLCELSLKEVRKITRFSEAKIKVDLHRGRKNMHQHLKSMLGKEIEELL